MARKDGPSQVGNVPSQIKRFSTREEAPTRTKKMYKKGGVASLGAEGLKEGNDVGTVLVLLQASERHLVSGHELLGVQKVLVQDLSGPGHSRLAVRLRVCEPGHGSGGTSDNSVQVGTHSVGSSLCVVV